ncbi:Eco57I restriction-modification methylase domain-containing protein [Porphyromonas gingivalis]|uniref:Eco57I restriction-modification methylase domain-containing protein n=1 Tax=Porphyromonas gingivalis TaxID=837 RepID=UPI000BE74F10|nr:TaqI-like C-terminal specificity domain-containing protein [Porphyromonas gingivalis]PDP40498.1 restriction endonuclease [Porphyromonas gingivalis]
MNYKEVIESKYNRESWQQLLHDIFRGKVSFWNRPSEVHVSSRLAKQALNLGKISLSDGESIAVYEVELTDNMNIERNRRGIRDMLTTDWHNMGYAGAFMFCFRKDESVLRFSYVSEAWGFNKQGEYEKISTDTKRYTYLLGEGRGCRTAIEQFKILHDSKLTLSDITAAFSVETLTKQFYKDLFEWYQWAVEPTSNITFPNNTTTEDDDRDDIETKIIRMITRIMFVWFIKQKNLVPDRIFDINFLSTILKDFDPYSTSIGNYYNAILQNLFFGTLNRAIKDEDGNTRKFATSSKRDIKTLYRYAEMFAISEQEVIEMFAEIPFLNGGLFECLDKTRDIDGVKQCYNFDGFSRNELRFADGRYKHRAVVPNNLFFEPEKGLISILNRYNFTIEENSPEEQQVALDPELLGKVFENLLGAYNPETKETARNQSGSFYTPREIVNYMVDESLIAYLGDNDFTRSLFRNDFSFEKSKIEEYKKLAEKIKTVKILDPACGSGAFPMGLLNRMVEILERISPDEDVYNLKLSVIENCLYGSDIQSIAAQITKLRFFISLICDCEKDASKPNFGIPTLPNLETKFVSANSLVAKKKKPAEGNLFENPEIEPTKNELAEIRHKHFSAKSASTKHRLREKDQVLREKLAKLLSDDDNFAPEDAKQLAAWNPYDQNAVSPFFDPEWMFGVADGFDIVIGNPPYLRIQGIRNSNSDFADYLVANYNSATGSFDLYVAFVERALQLISSNGIVNFIMPVKWTNAAFGKGLRDVVSKQKAAKKIINFSEYQVFNASTYTGLQWFKPNSDCLEYYELDRNLESNIELKSYLENLSKDTSSIVNTDKLNKDTWVLASSEVSKLLNKLNEQPLRLEDVFEKIFQGIATSKDDVYFIYDCTETQSTITGESKQLNKRVTIEKGLVKPLLKGEDVHRYDNLSSNRYVIFPYKLENGTANLYAEEELKLLFPNGYAYLKECETLLRGREKGRLKNDIYWYRYIYPKNLTLFQSPKLVAPEISLGGNFSYDGNGQFYSTTTIYGYIMKESCNVSYETLMAILNSKLCWWFMSNTGTVLAQGYYRYKPAYLKPLPIPQISKETDSEIKSLVAGLAKQDASNRRFLERKIDIAIYDLYSINDDDIELINRTC